MRPKANIIKLRTCHSRVPPDLNFYLCRIKVIFKRISAGLSLGRPLCFENRKRFFTGAQPKAGTGHKMQTVLSFFQRYIVRDIPLIYRLFVTFESVRWLIEILSAILKSTRGQSRERLQLFGERHVPQPSRCTSL